MKVEKGASQIKVLTLWLCYRCLKVLGSVSKTAPPCCNGAAMIEIRHDKSFYIRE